MPRASTQSTQPTRPTADSRPSREFASLAARAIEIHIAAGNWACAFSALERAQYDHAASLADRAARLARGPAAWLAEPLASLEQAPSPIPLRVINHFEDRGCLAIRDALELLASGSKIVGVAETENAKVWKAAQSVGIDIAEFGAPAALTTPAPSRETNLHSRKPTPVSKSARQWNRGVEDLSLCGGTASNGRRTE